MVRTEAELVAQANSKVVVRLTKEELNQKTDEMLTVDDIKNHLKIGKDSAYELVKLSTFPSIKIGNKYRIPLSEYKKWLEKSVGKEYIIR